MKLRIVESNQPCLVARCQDCGVESFPASSDRAVATETALEQGFKEIRGATYCPRCAERSRGEP